MFVAHFILLLACAAPLLAQDLNQCSGAMIGGATSQQIILPVAAIERLIRTALIDIPDNCAVQGSVVKGNYIKVCDYDVQPKIEVISLMLARVTRQGVLATQATVSVTQYCGV